MWWVAVGQWLDTHPAALSVLLLLRRTEGKSGMKKLVSPDKDKEVTCQLLSWEKQAQLVENYFILLPFKIDSGSEKQEGKH